MKRFYLIGFMASGKTRLGKQLAKAVLANFIDLDKAIEQTTGKTVAQIFSENGEAQFREIEQEALHNTVAGDSLIVATGGGTPCFFDNIDWINAHGTSVYLKTPVSVLTQRLIESRGRRPLLTDVSDEDLEKYIQEKLHDREPFYGKANIILPERISDEQRLQLLSSLWG